jgi:hypothetical protein
VQGHFVIRLEATSPGARIPRVYQMSVDRDLFGSWVVHIAFGLRGRSGRVLRVLAETEQAVRRVLRQRLRRRTRPPAARRLTYQIQNIVGEIRWLA